MSGIRQEIQAFRAVKQRQAADARQLAAFQLACHFDLADALNAGPDARKRIVLRLERAIERERQRGIRKHWSYDLNRHIALKQALDRLRDEEKPGMKAKRRPRAPLYPI